MKGLLAFVLVMCATPVGLFRPFFGMMFYNWFALMKPEWIYGFPRVVPAAMLVAIFTFFGWLFSRERKIPPIDSTTLLILAFLGWMSVTTMFALDSSRSLVRYGDVAKILLFSLVMYSLLTTRRRIQIALWVLCFGIAFWGVKGAIGSGIFRGGSARVFGPLHSVIEDNNNLGVALVTIAPLLLVCRSLCPRGWMRHGMTVVIALTFVGTLLTYSRGAMLGIAIVTVMIWLRSRHKIPTAIAIGVLGFAVIQYAPAGLTDRFGTIQGYQTDGSAQERLYLWQLNWEVAKERPVIGAGFNWMFNRDNANRVAATGGLPPIPTQLAVAHSIYFENLGEHGFPGLILYLFLLSVVFRNGLWLSRNASDSEEDEWLGQFGRMIPASIIAFLVAGAFASVTSYEGYFQMFVIVAAARSCVARELAAKAAQISAPQMRPVSYAFADSVPVDRS